jgi:hypothetical protein
MTKGLWINVIAALLFAACITVVGCGGGGGSGSSAPVTYSISGNVSGDISAAVTITLTGPVNTYTTTDVNGDWTFTALPNGNYTVAPSKTGYIFSPLSRPANVSGANITALDFVSTTSAGPTYSISGTVSGATAGGVTMTLSGDNSGGTTTAGNGTYTFAGIADGNYNVTPAKSGYVFSPTNQIQNVSGANVTGVDFTASVAPAPLSISGAIIYTGTKTGLIYIAVNSDYGQTGRGTSVVSTTSGAFTIRGIQPNQTYTLEAYMDNMDNGMRHFTNPYGESTAPFAVGTTSVTGKNVTLNDSIAPTVTIPTGGNDFFIVPADTSAMIFWKPVEQDNLESASYYKIYYSTLDTVSKSITTGGGTISTGPSGDKGFIMKSGLVNGTALYFVLTAVFGVTESAESDTFGPVTIGAPTPANYSIAGTVNSGVTPTGPLYVGVYNNDGISLTRIASPTISQAYTINSIASGVWSLWAFVDMNNNGLPDAGDMQSFENNELVTITTTNKTGKIITLSSANARAIVTTEHRRSGANDSYGLDFEVSENLKRPVNVVINSGPNVTGPIDMSKDMEWGGFNSNFWLDAIRPTVGVYSLSITYSNSTTENVNVSVTTVLDCFARDLIVTPTPSALVPTFGWLAPSSPPAGVYGYGIEVQRTSDDANMWYYPDDGTDIPSTQTSVVYNVDTYAMPLSGATSYRWTIKVTDINGNEAVIEETYTTP